MRLENRNDIAVLRLEGGRANAMNPELIGRFTALLDEAGGRPLVLTGYERYFSAGLDLPSLFPYERPKMQAMMGEFHRAMRKLFLYPGPAVAAINGHAIAGGCVLAMMCDWRVMAAGESKIGLNEVQLGVGLPAVVVEAFRAQLAPAALATVCLEGPLLSAEQAREAGLVHEISDAPLERAVEKAAALATSGRAAFAQIKQALRRPAAQAMDAALDEDTPRWLDVWFDAETRTRVGNAVAWLTSRTR